MIIYCDIALFKSIKILRFRGTLTLDFNYIYIYIYIYIYTTIQFYLRRPHGVMGREVDCEIVLNECELSLGY